MSKQAVALIAALLVVTGLLVTGCGGDDDNDASGAAVTEATTDGAGGTESSDGTDSTGEADPEGQEDTSALTKAAFVKQGDAICAESQQRIAAQGTKFFNDKKKYDDDELEIVVIESVLAPEFQTMNDHLRELGVPEGDEEEVEEMLDAFQARADLANEDARAFFDAEGQRGGTLTVRAEKLAKEYGFKVCPTG